MPNEPWRPPDADDTGFTSLYKVTKRAERLEPEAFVKAYPYPGLLVQYEGEAPEPVEKPDSSVQLLTLSMHASGILRYLNKLGFLCKRPGNPYAHLVSIGRSSTNDLVVAIDSVSKVHGTFAYDRTGWSYTDRGSTNGSKINGDRVEPGARTPIASGDKIKLGGDAVFEILAPHVLYERLRGTL